MDTRTVHGAAFSNKTPRVNLHFLLLGKTGVGKSETGNTLLQREVFGTSCDSTSDTSRPDCGIGPFKDCDLLVVDTPGLCDTRKDALEDVQAAAENMKDALDMCFGRVDAFLFIIKYGDRFSREYRDTFDDLRHILRSDYTNHMIVIFTHGDIFHNDRLFKKDQLNFLTWCQKQQRDLAKMYRDCGGRFLLFNNRADNKDKVNQIQDLVSMTLQINLTHGRCTISFSKGVTHRRENWLLLKMEPILKKKAYKKIANILTEFEQLGEDNLNTSEVNIKSDIKKLEQEIEMYDARKEMLGDLRKLIDEVKHICVKSDKVFRLEQELKEINENNNKVKILGDALTVAAAIFAPRLLPVTAGGTHLAATYMNQNVEEKQQDLQKARQEQRMRVETFRRQRNLLF